MPTVEAALKAARMHLGRSASASLDARLLLQAATGLSHAALIADPHRKLLPDDGRKLQEMLARRASGEPISRILGWREFYGRPFKVTPAVLDPRPDTECLIDAALALLPDDQTLRILDLGTGSGIIAITLLAERRNAAALAVDVSAAALDVARRNAQKLGVSDRLSLQQSDWFDGVTGTFDAILSNPPYIETGDLPLLAPEVKDHDPQVALDGGQDGLHGYRAIAAGALPHLKPGGFVAVETGAGQQRQVATIFKATGFRPPRQYYDLGGHARCLIFHHARQV